MMRGTTSHDTIIGDAFVSEQRLKKSCARVPGVCEDQEDEREEDGGGAPELVPAGGTGRFCRCITGTFSHTADSWKGSDLQPEIPSQQMGDMMNRFIMYDEREWALGRPERFISVKPACRDGDGPCPLC